MMDRLKRLTGKKVENLATGPRVLVLDGRKFGVDKNGYMDLSQSRAPNIPVSKLPAGVKYIVFNNLFTIVIEPDRSQNVRIFDVTRFKIDPSCDKHNRFLQQWDRAVQRAQKHNPSVRDVTNFIPHDSWVPTITARIDAISVPELLLRAENLGIEVVGIITMVVKEMVPKCPLISDVELQPGTVDKNIFKEVPWRYSPN
jgi:hypothetical protein